MEIIFICIQINKLSGMIQPYTTFNYVFEITIFLNFFVHTYLTIIFLLYVSSYLEVGLFQYFLSTFRYMFMFSCSEGRLSKCVVK